MKEKLPIKKSTLFRHCHGQPGFTNLAVVGGEKYSASGYVGMLDLVAALEWVRDNMANSGGDHGNIAITLSTRSV